MKKKKNEIVEEERKTQDMSVVAEYTGEKSNRAKLVEYEGDDYVDTPVKDDTIAGKTENFWYHYKWHVIFALIIIAVVFVGIYQIATSEKNKTDLSVMYAGPTNIHSEAAEGIKNALSEILTEDIDGDGEKKVYLYSFAYYNSQQIASAKDDAAKRDVDLGIDLGQNQKNYRAFSDLVFTGECGVMFLDGTLFESVKESGGLEVLEDALGYVPDKAFDEYGIRLCDTAAYEYYPELSVMPADTVVCLRTLSTLVSKKEAQSYYDAGVRLLGDILSASAPETNAVD